MKRSVGIGVVIRSFMVKVTLVEKVVDGYVAKSGSRRQTGTRKLRDDWDAKC